MEQTGTIDVGIILREIEAEIAEAEQRYLEAKSALDHLRGQRAGVLLVFERSQRRTVFTEGGEG